MSKIAGENLLNIWFDPSSKKGVRPKPIKILLFLCEKGSVVEKLISARLKVKDFLCLAVLVLFHERTESGKVANFPKLFEEVPEIFAALTGSTINLKIAEALAGADLHILSSVVQFRSESEKSK